MIRQYLAKNNLVRFKACVDRSSSYLNYRTARARLEKVSIGKVDVLPPAPILGKPYTSTKPLFRWHMLRRVLGLTEFSLEPNDFFLILYDDDKELLHRAHTAGVDVEMLLNGMKFFIDIWDDKPARGTIDYYFNVSGVSDQDLQDWEKEETDAMPKPTRYMPNTVV